MQKKSILITLLGLALLSGCTSSSTIGKEVKGMENAYSVIKTSKYPVDPIEYHDGEKAFLVYHSDTSSDVSAFSEEYQKLTGDDAPAFEGNMIIAKSGTKSTGGYGISIESVVDAERYTEVTLLLERPGAGCLTTMALTNPYIVAALPNDHKDVTFIEKNITVDCQ